MNVLQSMAKYFIVLKSKTGIITVAVFNICLQWAWILPNWNSRQTYRRIRCEWLCASRIEVVFNGCFLIFNRLHQTIQIIYYVFFFQFKLSERQTSQDFWLQFIHFEFSVHSHIMHEQFHSSHLESLSSIISLNLLTNQPTKPIP